MDQDHPTSPPDISLVPPEPPGLIHRIFLNQREVRSGWRLLVFVALWSLILAGMFGLAHVFWKPAAHHITAQVLLVSEALMFAAALIAAAILGVAEKRRFADYALPWSSAFQARFWWGVVWGGIALTVLLALIKVGGGFSFGPLSAEAARPLLAAAGLWIAVSLLTGFYEEFFFRGYALFTLTTGIGFWPSAVVLSIAFGAFHLGNPGENWSGALAAMLIGLFFCFALRRTGNLWFPIGFHAMWDYCENFIFAVPDSGIVMGKHLFRSASHGPRWLTGGSVGPEGSVFVFVVIAGLFILLHLLYPDARFGIHRNDATVAVRGRNASGGVRTNPA